MNKKTQMVVNLLRKPQRGKVKQWQVDEQHKQMMRYKSGLIKMWRDEMCVKEYL